MISRMQVYHPHSYECSDKKQMGRNENDWCLRSLGCNVRYTEMGTTSANEMNFVMNHAPGASWQTTNCTA